MEMTELSPASRGRSGRVTRLLLAPVAACAMLVGAFAAPALAQPASHSSNARAIRCSVHVSKPRKSGKSVVAPAALRCSSKVSAIAIDVGVYYNGKLKASKKHENHGKSSLAGTASEGCVSGKYVTGALGGVKFPNGHIKHYKEKFSKSVSIKC